MNNENKKRMCKNRHILFLFIGRSRGLLSLLHLSLQLCEYVDVTQCGAGSDILNLWSIVLLGSTCLLGSSLLLLTLRILEGTAVRQDDALRVLVELNNLEGELSLSCA